MEHYGSLWGCWGGWCVLRIIRAGLTSREQGAIVNMRRSRRCRTCFPASTGEFRCDFCPLSALGFCLRVAMTGRFPARFPFGSRTRYASRNLIGRVRALPTGTHVPAWFDKADLEGDKTRWEGCLTVAFDARILQWGSVEEMDDCLRRFRLGDVGDRGFAPLPVRKARGLISGDTGADVLTAPSIHQCVGKAAG